MNPSTLLKSLNEAIEEIDEGIELKKSAAVDDDELLEDDDEILEDDNTDDEDTILQKARDILKARKAKKSQMSDDDYTDDELDDDEEDDDEDMEKAKDGNLPNEGDRDAAVLAAGRGMRTIIYMRKSLKRQEDQLEEQDDLIKSLKKDIRTLTKAMSSNLDLTRKLGELVINGTELQKSVKDELEELGDQPVRTVSVRSRKNKGGGNSTSDFRNPQNDVERAQLLEKSVKAVRDHKLPDHLITMLEGRIGAQRFNPNLDLFTDELAHLRPFLESDDNKRAS